MPRRGRCSSGGDCIIVASVSCIYGIGSKEDYLAMRFDLHKGDKIDRQELISRLITLQYKRNDIAFERGTFRVRGDTVELFPTHMEDRAWRFSLFGDELEGVTEFDPLTGEKFGDLDGVRIYANSHYITPGPTMQQAITQHQKRPQSTSSRFFSRRTSSSNIRG